MECIVFNHHALPFDHPSFAEKAVPGFLKTCIQASNAGMRTILVDETLDNSWFRIELAAGYFWQDWYEQHQNEADVQNFYNYEIFSIHLPEILQKRRDALVSGKEILALFEETYPGVFHCGKAAQQLGNWSGSNTILNQVKQALGVLSQFALGWQRGGFSHYSGESLKASGLQCQVSGESRTVRDNPDLRRQREFWLPRGEKKFFEQHIKLASGYRLHFYPDNETRNIFVGYIGPHLKLK